MLTGHRGIRAAAFGVLAALAMVAVGLTAPAQAVVHGDSADPAQFPFLLALAKKMPGGSGDTFNGRYEQFCGASLVAPRKAITAAHCVFEGGSQVATSDLVLVAAPQGSKDETDSQVRSVSNLFVHPNYDDQQIVNDIAVLTLEDEMVGIPTVVPSSDDSGLSEADVWSAGWGSIKRDTAAPEYPDLFRVAPMTVFPAASCGAANPDPYVIGGYSFTGVSSVDVDYDKQICAQGYHSGQIVDTCVGDSGGPLVAGAGANTRLVGLVSWGPDVCASDEPGIYTRVSAYRNFLEDHGVSFAVPDDGQPDEPVVVTVTPSATRLAVKIHAAVSGDHPSAFWATATDPQGDKRYCVVSAPAGTANANCVITGLTTGTRYRVTAWAETGWSESVRTADVIATPATAPSAPRIDTRHSTLYSTYAVIKVTGFVANGSAITDKYVKCTARNHPVLKAPVNAKGYAKVTKFERGAKYTCRAYAVNSVGTSLPSVGVSVAP